MRKVLNPFFISPIMPEEYFCDRRNETSRLSHLIRNGNNVVLISPRRMGKTGLIRHLYGTRDISREYNTFFVDILHTTSLKEFTFCLSKEIFETLKPAGKKIIDELLAILKSLSGKMEYNPVTGMPELAIQLGDIRNPETTLDEIFKYLDSSKKPCIMTIDEFQQIREYKDNVNVEALLRSLVQKTPNCRFVFSGSHKHVMSDMFSSSRRPFYNSADILPLEAIPEEVYAEFASEKFNAFDRMIPETEIKWVYEQFCGYTYNIQRVMNEVFSSVAPGNMVDHQVVEYAISDILDSNATTYRELLSTLTEKQKQVLVAIAKDINARNLTSEAFVSRHVLPSASAVQNALRKLLSDEIVYKEDETYSVYDKFLAMWLRRTF